MRIECGAVAAFETHVATVDLVPSLFLAPAETAGDTGEHEFRQRILETDGDILELDVADEVARRAAREAEPEPQRTLAATDPDRQRQPLPPGRDVGVVEARVEVALDLAPVPEPVAAPLAAHVDRRGELGRRRAAQSQPVDAEPVLEPELDPVEEELRRIAQVVVPGDERVAHQDLALVEHPVGEA